MSSKVFIIAEAGVNHNGDILIAKKMIEAAHEAGADAIKFQTFKSELLVTKTSIKADYQKASDSSSETQYQMLKKLELNRSDFEQLQKLCKKKGIVFLSTPFDLESIELLNDLGLEIIKIGSGEIINLPYLKYIGSLNKKIILSSGMSTLDEIKNAVLILNSSGTPKKNITVLHANTEYPSPYKDVNLNAMKTIAKNIGVKVGYSDHTTGIEIPIAAVAMGACVIEKHFTLDRKMNGPDHKASLEPDELKQMISSIRNIEIAMGSGIKKPSESEIKNISIVRKSIVAKKAINKGEIFTENNICTKRPGTGISPMEWERIIGSKAKKDYQEDDLI
ncbi:N-acetylneuraminate synthase [Bacteroidota bacterium]